MLAVDAAVNGGVVVTGFASAAGDLQNFASAAGVGGDDAESLTENNSKRIRIQPFL